MRSDQLFCGAHLHDVIETHTRKVKEEVDGLAKDHFLNTAPDALVAYLVAKHRLDVPRLLEGRRQLPTSASS